MDFTILRHTLRARRRGLAIWAASVAVVSGGYAAMYPMMEDMDMAAMLEAMPPAMVEALGYDNMDSAAGYLGSAVYGLVALALLMVFVIGSGSQLIAGPEERGELELELTSRVSRTSIYLQRFCALGAQVKLVVGALFLAMLAVNGIAGLDVPVVDLAIVSLQLWLLLLFFGSFSFAVGAATGRKKLAQGVSAGLAVVSWAFNAIGPTAGQDWMASVSPIGWYMADNPVTRGFHPMDAGLLVGASVVVLVLGLWRFGQRDLMT